MVVDSPLGGAWPYRRLFLRLTHRSLAEGLPVLPHNQTPENSFNHFAINIFWGYLEECENYKFRIIAQSRPNILSLKTSGSYHASTYIHCSDIKILLSIT